MNTSPLLYSVKEAALLTSLGDKEIYDAIHAGELEAVRRGRRILIPAQALSAFVEAMPRIGDGA